LLEKFKHVFQIFVVDGEKGGFTSYQNVYAKTCHWNGSTLFYSSQIYLGCKFVISINNRWGFSWG